MTRPVVLAIPTLSEQGAQRTKALIEQARAGTRVPDHFFVIDNGHKFGSATGVHVHRPPENVGVAPAWNIALLAYPDAAVILANDDIVLAPDSVERIERGVAEAPEGTGLVLTEGHGFTFFVPTSEALRRVGFFDEGFFPAYYEDTDYERRVRLEGMGVVRVPTGTRHDYCGTTTRDIGAGRPEQAAYWKPNEARYHKKWGGPKGQERYSMPWDVKMDFVVPMTRPSLAPTLIASLAFQNARPSTIYLVSNADLTGLETWGMNVVQLSFDSAEYAIGEGDVSLRRNIGTWTSTASWIVYSDDDQVWPKNAVEHFAISFLNGEKFVVGHHRFVPKDQLQVHGLRSADPSVGRSREHGVNRTHGWQSCYGGALGVDAKMIRETGGWDMSLQSSEDQQLAMRVVGAGKRSTVFVSEPPFAWHPEEKIPSSADPRANTCKARGEEHEWTGGTVRSCKKCPKTWNPTVTPNVGQAFDLSKVSIVAKRL